MSKPFHTILSEATPAQIKSWWAQVQNDQWPADMPIPMEAFADVWHSLQKRFIDLPATDTKHGEACGREECEAECKEINK